MTRQELIAVFRAQLGDLPYQEVEAACGYYEEYLLDAIENGQTEEDAVASLGDPLVITGQIRNEAALRGAVNRPGVRAWSHALVTTLGAHGASKSPLMSVLVIALAVLCVILAICVVAGVGALFVGGVIVIVTMIAALPFTKGVLGALLFAAGLAILGGLACYYLLMLLLKACSWLYQKIYLWTMDKRRA